MHRFGHHITGQAGKPRRHFAQLLGPQCLSQQGEPHNLGECDFYRAPSRQLREERASAEAEALAAQRFSERGFTVLREKLAAYE